MNNSLSYNDSLKELTDHPSILYWLSSYVWMNQITACRLLDYFKSPDHIFSAQNMPDHLLTPSQKKDFFARKAEWNPEQKYAEFLSTGISMISFENPQYPQKLKTIPDPPLALFLKGTLPPVNRPSVAIIGSRQCSPYGLSIAKELSLALAREKIPVISGMARGIDGVSQTKVLESGGYSLAVLGCGCDICYPSENLSLYHMLAQNGGLLSTYPPKTPPKPYLFPMRNRIVSGLCDSLVVIEARQKSGTLITVDMALEQGREVYAVPGRITDRLSDGTNGLIGQGANIYLSPDIFIQEILELWQSQSNSSSKQAFLPKGDTNCIDRKSLRRKNFCGETTIPPNMSSECLKVYKALTYSPISAEELLSLLSPEFTLLELQMLLMQLVVDGFALQISSNTFTRS